MSLSSRKAHLIAASFAVAAAIFLMFVPMAQAQSSDPFLLIRRVTGGTATNPAATTLDVVYTGNAADLGSAKLRENGADVQLSAPAKNEQDMGIVFVIDSGPGAASSSVLTATPPVV